MPVDIFEPCPDAKPGDNEKLADILSMLENDREPAMSRLVDFVQAEPDDIVLQNLLYRLNNLEPGGYYALD